MGAGTGQRTSQRGSQHGMTKSLSDGSKKGRQGKPADKPSRKQQAENTHRKLADAALRLFASEGYDHVVVDDICREVGVSKGTFYVHFASKDQVLVEEFLALDRSYTDTLVDIDKIDTGAERLLAFGRFSLRHISNLGKDYIKAAYSSQIAPGRGPSALASPARASHEIALRLVMEAQEEGGLRCDLPAEVIATVLVRMIRGIVIDWCLLDGGFDLEREGEQLLEILLDGLKPRVDKAGKRIQSTPGRKGRG